MVLGNENDQIIIYSGMKSFVSKLLLLLFFYFFSFNVEINNKKRTINKGAHLSHLKRRGKKKTKRNFHVCELEERLDVLRACITSIVVQLHISPPRFRPADCTFECDL